MGKHISILQGGVITTLTDNVDKEILDYTRTLKIYSTQKIKF